MPLSDAEFSAIMADEKRIAGDIRWRQEGNHPTALSFRVKVESDMHEPLLVKGRYDWKASKLTYTLFSPEAGRLCGLDMGTDHHNPQCRQVGDTHLHRWSEQHDDQEAHVPESITACLNDPVAVWAQFCELVGIEHQGKMNPPMTKNREIA